MMYAQVEDDAVVEYPVDLRNTFPNTSFPFPVNPESLPEGIVEVLPSSLPEVEEGFHLEELAPELIDGVWFQAWSVVAD